MTMREKTETKAPIIESGTVLVPAGTDIAVKEIKSSSGSSTLIGIQVRGRIKDDLKIGYPITFTVKVGCSICTQSNRDKIPEIKCTSS